MMPPGRDFDHAGTCRGLQCRQQAEGELEVAEVVGRELRFVAAGIALQRPAHDARVVDQDVQRPPRVAIPGDERVDRRRVEEVQPADLDALETRQCGCGAVRVADAHRDRRAGPAERARGFQTEPDVATGDHDVAAGEVDACDHVLGRRCRGET